MGFWEVLYSTTDKLKQNAPTAVTNACRSCYDMGSAAIRKIDNAVNDGVQKVKDYLSDSQSRETLGQIVTTIAKYEADVAARILLRRGTGGLHIYNLLRNELVYLLPSNRSSKKFECSQEMMEEMQREMMEEMQEKMDKMKEVIYDMMEEMQRKIDKMQEEINNINYDNKIILQRIERCESPDGNIPLGISTKALDLGPLICSHPAPPVVVINSSQTAASTTLRCRRIRNLPVSTTSTSSNAAALPLPYCSPVRQCRPTQHCPKPLQPPSFCFPLSSLSSKSLPHHRVAR